MYRYKIEISEGCTAFWTAINDELVQDISKDKLAELYEYIGEELKKGLADGTINLDSVLGCFQYEDYEYSDISCGQCGDTVSLTTWKI